ncbi:MAG TPA: YkvA family protein [Dehalococcoidia bacterium]|nr:YkvA family protein [Dehalococcoidia bacterium]
MGLDTWLLIILALFVGSFLALIAIAGFVWWRLQTSDEKKLARRIAKLRFSDKLSLAADIFRDPRVSIVPSLIAVALIAYLAMPIDIIPDFIPVLGYADDLLILVIGAGLLLRSIPPHVLEEHVRRFERSVAHNTPPGAEPPRELTPGG